jgi:CheY-like chemotaxis protein
MSAMESESPLRILLIEDNKDFAKLVETFLRKHGPEQFEIVWRQNGTDARAELGESSAFDIILMDYFLPGQNGLEVTRSLRTQNIRTPIIFLTVNKDFDLALEVMKLGVEDYLVKEEVSTPVLPKTILNVIDRQKLRDQLTALEITERRLEAIQELVVKITDDIRVPLHALRKSVDELANVHMKENFSQYFTIIRDNLARIEMKVVKLKELKTDKTVPYIRDIRMLDLS